MTAFERNSETKHWREVIKKYDKIRDKRIMTRDEYQQYHYAESKLEQAYNKAVDSGECFCRTTTMEYDPKCQRHGWI